MANPHVNIAHKYARDVRDGKIDVCLYVKQACIRHLNDWDLSKKKNSKFPYKFIPELGEQICNFAETMTHVSGKWKGTLLKLQPWQCFIFSVAFGWVNRSDNLRRFREIYIEVPRKNGKSVTAAIIGNYMFAVDGEPGAEIYSGATTEKQAMKVFEPAWLMTVDNKEYAEYFGLDTSGTRKYPKGIYCLSTNSKFFPIVGLPGDGDSPHCAIVDEYHEHRTSDLYDTMGTGMGARQQPLLVVITTAGTNTASPCYDKRSQCIKVLSGEIVNDSIFTVIYTLDKDDDWTDFNLWRKANPNYQVSLFEPYLRKQYNEAMQAAAKQNILRCKHLNQWCNAGVAWMDINKWENCADPELRMEDFAGEDCWVGIDLASKIDLAAMSILFRRGEIYYLFVKFYLPEERAKGEDKTHYAGWAHDGYITLTPGNRIDIDVIEEDLRHIARNYNVLEVPHDPWNAAQFVAHMQKEGIEMIEVPQTVGHLSEPTKEMEALVLEEKLFHDGNPVLSWCVGNVVINLDKKDNVFPYKEKPENKIDGAIASILALSRSLHSKPTQAPQVTAVC